MTTPKPTPLLDEDAAPPGRNGPGNEIFGRSWGWHWQNNVLIQRLLTIVRAVEVINEFAAILIFTEKAATELRERLFLEIDAALETQVGGERQNLREAQRAINHAAALPTVDAFCADKYENGPWTRAFDPDFTVLDAVTVRVLRRETVGAIAGAEMNRSPGVLEQLSGINAGPSNMARFLA